MKQIKSLLFACATLAATTTVFGITAVGPGPLILSPAVAGDEFTYYFTGTGNLSGSITLNASSGNWTGPTIAGSLLSPSLGVVSAEPIVAFDIFTPDGELSSANFPTTYITNTAPTPTITWNATQITSMDMDFVDSDPFSLDIDYTGGNFSGDLSGLSSEDVNSGALDAAVPDNGATWILLAGVCAAFGSFQFVQRRSVKVN